MKKFFFYVIVMIAVAMGLKFIKSILTNDDEINDFEPEVPIQESEK